MKLDDELLSDFAYTFYGYGDYDAPYWFVGMEEGGADTPAEIQSRLAAWDTHGRPELDDLRAFGRRAGVGQWFEPHPPIQPTWGKLIRLALAAEGRAPSREDVRRFQRDEIGRPGGITAVLELLPLPSPSTNHWLYADLSDLPRLADRETYRDHYAPRRAAHIGRRIQEHRPKAVVFYGKGYRPWWEEVARSPFDDSGDALRAERDGTTFLIMPHPVAMGVTNDAFERAGRSLA